MTESQRNEYEKGNIETFERHGTHRSREYMYTCVMCGEKTCIEDSYSNGGAHLLCRQCAKKTFGMDEDRFMKMARWMAYGFSGLEGDNGQSRITQTET